MSLNERKAPPRGLVAALAAVTVVCCAAGAIALVRPAHDYVERMAPPWAVLAGALCAAFAILTWRFPRGRTVGVVAGTVFLLPAGGALLLFHTLRLVGAIPLPIDWGSALVSLCAALLLVVLWVSFASTAEPKVVVRAPRWVAWAGFGAALLYPVAKVSWALGSGFLAPPGAVGVVDAAFWVTVAVGAAAATAPVIALRWWTGASPRWGHRLALGGGFLLCSIGFSGLWSIQVSTDDASTGLLVYGGWLLWGVAVLVIAAHLRTARDVQATAADAGGVRWRVGTVHPA